MQLRMGEVASLVRGTSTVQEQDYATKAGKTLLDSFINSVVANGFGGNSTNSLGNVRETLDLAKDIAGVQDSKEQRLINEIEELREQNKHLHDVKSANSMSDMAKLIEVLMGVVNTANEKTDRTYAMLIDTVREVYKKPDSDDNNNDLLRKIGIDAIMARLNSDPREEFDRQRKYWYEIYKAEHSNNENIISFEKWKAQKHVDLEEKKLELEVKRQESLEAKEDKAADRQNRMIENLALAITGMASKGNSTKDEINQAINAGMVLVTCPNCNDEFVLTQPKDHISCPFCKTELSIGQQTA